MEALLQAQASEFERDEEVERIIKAFRLNPFDILDLPHDATERYASAHALGRGMELRARGAEGAGRAQGRGGMREAAHACSTAAWA